MSNSKYVEYVKYSPNYTPVVNKIIRKITPHHAACNVSIETMGNLFADEDCGASANYGIDSDGRIGLYVSESDRAWTSSNRDNDGQAVTIEVANDEYGGQWHVSDKALNALIKLCIDICQRNGIKRLNYTGDASGNLTRHNMFDATACPGPYLQSKFPYIEKEVNKALERAEKEKEEKENEEMRYNKVAECPKYAQPTIQKLMDKGILKGDANGDLNLTLDMIRIFVIHDRLGLYD